MPMASSAASGASSDSRSERTSQSAPPMPMTPAIRRPVTGWTSCAQTKAWRASPRSRRVRGILTAYNRRTRARLLQGLDVGDDVVNLLAGDAGHRLHLAFALGDSVFDLGVGGGRERLQLDLHGLGNGGI